MSFAANATLLETCARKLPLLYFVMLKEKSTSVTVMFDK